MKNIIKEWEACQLIKIFEIKVVDRRDGTKNYIIFDIEIAGNQFVAQHESLNSEQAASSLIASVKRDIDPDFSLDENLQELYDDCIDAIDRSEYFWQWDDSYDINKVIQEV